MQLNREKLAELLGCSLRTVDEYRRQGMPGEPPARPGGQWRFESSAVIQWLRDNERQGALGEVAKVDEGEARRRKLAAEASIAEHELAIKQGAAVSVRHFAEAVSKIIGAARAKLRPIGSAVSLDVARETEPAVCQVIIDAAINEALQELSDDEIRIEPGGISEPEPGDPAGPEDLGATTGPDSKRVGGRRKTPKS